MFGSRLSEAQRERRYLFIAILGSVPVLAVHLLLPLSGDNEVYQSMAKDLLHYHLLPYIGSWDMNFPGIVYYHWLAMVVFGDSALAFHGFDIIVHLAVSVVLFSFLRRWLTPRISCLAVLLYNFHYCSSLFDTSGQRDALAVIPLLIGTSLLYRLRDRTDSAARVQWIIALLAGVSFAAMVALRVTNLSFFSLAVLFLVSFRSGNTNGIAFFLGAAALGVAVVLPYLLVPGGIQQFYLSTITFNIRLYGHLRYPLTFLVRELQPLKYFLLLVALGLVVLIIPKIRHHPRLREQIARNRPLSTADILLFASYLFAALAAYFVMGKYWTAQFEPVLFLLMPFAAIGIDLIISVLPRLRYQIIGAAILILYPMIRVFPIPLFRSLERQNWSGVYGPRNGLDIADTGFSGRTDAEVASYIDRSSPPDARFECASIMAGVRWRVDRESATRFTTFYPIFMPPAAGRVPAFQRAWKTEYIDSLRSAKPYYLVLSSVSPSWIERHLDPPMRFVHSIPGFDSLILPHYRFDTMMGTYVILKRRD